MKHVSFKINNHSYEVYCEPAQEVHFLRLAEWFDARVSELSSSLGRKMSQELLLVLTALQVCDDLSDCRAEIGGLQEKNKDLSFKLVNAGVDTKALARLASAIDSLEALSSELRPVNGGSLGRNEAGSVSSVAASSGSASSASAPSTDSVDSVDSVDSTELSMPLGATTPPSQPLR